MRRRLRTLWMFFLLAPREGVMKRVGSMDAICCLQGWKAVCHIYTLQVLYRTSMHECNRTHSNVEACECRDASVQTLLYASYAQMQKRPDVMTCGAPRCQQKLASSPHQNPYVLNQNELTGVATEHDSRKFLKFCRRCKK